MAVRLLESRFEDLRVTDENEPYDSTPGHCMSKVNLICDIEDLLLRHF